jgi:hypothetical protein
MAIPKLEADVKIVSKIPNYPGSEGGLTPEEFKQKFDEAPQIIKDFINNVLIPKMDETIDVQALLNGVLDSTLTQENKAAQAKATGDALNQKLPKSGGSMTGGINMGGKAISNLANPSADTDAANKGYVREQVSGTYKPFTATLSAAGWSENAPYTQKVNVSGVLQSDRPHVGLVPSDDTDTALAQEESWGYVSRGVTADGSITFTCYEDKPQVDIPLQIEVNR